MSDIYMSIKFGSPEWKKFMAKRNASRAAGAVVAACTVLDANPVASVPIASSPSTSKIATSIFDAVSPETFKSVSAAAAANVPNAEEMGIGDNVNNVSQAQNVHDYSTEDFSRDRNFGAESMLPPGIILLKSSGPSFYTIRVYPDSDGRLRSSDGQVHRVPHWGAASRLASDRPKRETFQMQSTQCRQEFINPRESNEFHKEAAQSPESVQQSKPTQNPQQNTQHHEEVTKRSGQYIQDHQPFIQRNHRSIEPSHSPRPVYSTVHLRSFNSYGALNYLKDRPELRLRELREELTTRGLPVPSTNNWRDLASVLVDNDKEWRQELLDLETVVLSELWDEGKVDFFIRTKPFKYFDYGDLEDAIVDHEHGADKQKELEYELRGLHREALSILLVIAKDELVPLDCQRSEHRSDVARMIAEFRARKTATEDSTRRQLCEPYARSRIAKPQDDDPSTAHVMDRRGIHHLQGGSTKRQRDIYDESITANKKPRTNSVPVVKVSTPGPVKAVTTPATPNPKHSITSAVTNPTMGVGSSSLGNAPKLKYPAVMETKLHARTKEKTTKVPEQQRKESHPENSNKSKATTTYKSSVESQESSTNKLSTGAEENTVKEPTQRHKKASTLHSNFKSPGSSEPKSSPSKGRALPKPKATQQDRHSRNKSGSGSTKRKKREEEYDLDDDFIDDDEAPVLSQRKKKRRNDDDGDFVSAKFWRSRFLKE